MSLFNNEPQRLRRFAIKICGLTRPDEALACAAAGADAIGLNFYPKSPRFLSVEQAGEIAREMRDGARSVLLVGVFVNADVATLRAAFDGGLIDVAQLHGDEPPEAALQIACPVWKALRLGGPFDLAQVDRFARFGPGRWERLVIDAPCAGFGGSGRRIDTDLAARAVAAGAGCPVILAGGLAPDNVADAIRQVRPAGIDVASGVESAPGRKDLSRVAALIAAARAADGLLSDPARAPYARTA